MSPPRTRTVTWEDPQRGPTAARTMSGLDYMDAIRRGDLPPPPIAPLLGFTLVEISPGRAVFTLEPGEHQYNVIGVMHGGIAATLLDSAMGCAVLSQLPAGMTFTTAQLNLHYVRAAHAGTGTLRAEARVIHPGRKVATAEGTLKDASGKLYAHGTTTCIILPIEPEAAAPPNPPLQAD